MITTIKINKEIKVQKCENNGIKIILNLKGKHKSISFKMNVNDIELFYFIISIILKNQE